MLKTLKAIGYLIAAVAVLTVLFSGGILIIGLGLLVGFLLSLLGSVLLTASGIKSLMESPEKDPID